VPGDRIQSRRPRALIELVANPALTGFTAPKILWVREHEPKVYAKTKHILLPKDYIRYCMTGEYATEVSDASGTLLLDVVNRTWSMNCSGSCRSTKPVAAALARIAGSHGQTARPSGGRRMGLPGIPVVGGGGDQAAGAVGNGIVTAGIVSATLGTSGVSSPTATAHARSARPRSHHVPCRPRQMVRLRLHALGRRQLSNGSAIMLGQAKSPPRKKGKSIRTNC
jgi:sugar (pentulose or hexulose) kinase